MSRSKRILLWVMALAYMFAGFNHLMNPDFYIAIMPPGLPDPEWLNVLSGLAEIVLGVYLLEPRTRVLAAWGIIALLIAVFPANLYVALENVGVGGPGTGAGAANYVRLPFQALLMVWAWWYTRPDDVFATEKDVGDE
jgi:uncharacterized membrane protein